MALRIFTSNRTEILLDQLAELLRASPPDPLRPETIVVQSKGMEKWLSHRLAEKLGCWAGFAFPFPNAVLHTLQERVLGPLPDPAPFEKEVLAWRVLGLLADPQARARHRELAGYLDGGAADLKAFQLALRIADTFDQYALYRPELLTRWEKAGDDDGWQGWLWRRLAEGREGGHRAALLRRFLQEAARLTAPPSGFPARLSLFGIPALPPAHMESFLAVSHLCEVNLFLLNPCREYWLEARSPRSMERLRLQREGEELPEEEHFDGGHPLLASLGRQGREFLDLLLGSPVVPGFDAEQFADPGEGTLLAALQHDILVFADGADGGDKPKRRTVGHDDRSLTFHSCHGPLREIETLHDELCGLFAADPTLRPRDVLIMTPDVELYAPFVSAVFGESEGDRPPIPVAVADRPARGETPLAEAFFLLLDLPRSRFAAPFVLDLLDIPELRARFTLSEDDAGTVARWVEETRIRWGLDGEDRAREGFVAFSENGWRAGLDRLLLGSAVAGDQPYAGILPHPVDSGDSAPLGGLASLVEELAAFDRELRQERPLADWAGLLSCALDRFFRPGFDSRDALETLRGHALSLGALADSSGYAAPVGLAVVRHHLERRLGERSSTRSFLTGKATCCSLLPMRSIPARVVALVGMDGKSFPRRDATPSFSVLADSGENRPRKGDRSLRDEDRYLFLETLLSARDRLIVNWTGRSAKDDTEIQPSVLVLELLDHLETAFTVDRPLVTRHHLQAFAPGDFDSVGGAGRSFSRQNAAAAQARRGARAQGAPFLRAPLPEAGPERREVTLDRLRSFFANPAAFFLAQRLSLALPQAEEGAADSEPIELGGLDRYQFEQELLAAALGGDPEAAFARAVARGDLPVGNLGRAGYLASLREAQGLARRVTPLLGGGHGPLAVDLRLGGFHLTGRLEPLGAGGLVRFRAARLKGKDVLRAWIDHLALNAVAGGHGRESFLLASDRSFRLAPVSDAPHRLEELLGLYWLGLCAPLPFFPESALAWAEKMAKKGDAGAAALAARERWEPANNRHARAESDDPAFRLCFGEIDPLADGAFTPSFADLSRAVFAPAMQAMGDLPETAP